MELRRKLFSNSTSRRKLFSSPEPLVKKIQCRDCGFEMEVSGTTMNYSCPKCGSKNRFNIVPVGKTVQENVPEPEPKSEEKSFTGRRSLFGEDEFQKEFSTPSGEYEKNLKLFSGKNVNVGDSEKLFGMTSDDMVEKGFARVDGDSMRLSDMAFIQSKLFSKLIVSVTKVLDLDEPTMHRPIPETIDLLDSHHSLPEKGIMIIKKAHRVPELRDFSECECGTESSELVSWVKDSRIVEDLKIEYGNTGMNISEFMSILKDRYPDAPEGIIDYLVNKEVVRINGNQVDFTN